LPAWQSVSLPHMPWQALTPLQKYGAHALVGFEHTPSWHVPPIVSVGEPAGHDACAHTVLLG
jgi:hypothetical protein